MGIAAAIMLLLACLRSRQRRRPQPRGRRVLRARAGGRARPRVWYVNEHVERCRLGAALVCHSSLPCLWGWLSGLLTALYTRDEYSS